MGDKFKIGFELEMVLRKGHLAKMEEESARSLHYRNGSSYSEAKVRKAMIADVVAFLPKKFRGIHFEVVDDGSVNTWVSSDAIPIELITPPLPSTDAHELLAHLFEYMKANGVETNYTTGLHVNVSYMDRKKNRRVLASALLTELDQDGMLRKYHRVNNEYCRPGLNKRRASKMIDHRVLSAMQNHPSRAINLIEERVMDLCGDKFQAVNINHMDEKNRYVEFRLIGNKGYEKKFAVVAADIHKMMASLERATLPDRVCHMNSDQLRPVAHNLVRKYQRIAGK